MEAHTGLGTGTAGRYTAVAIGLHWLIALAIIALLAMGLIMTSPMAGSYRSALFPLHKSIGITVLLLSLARLFWRLAHAPPAAPPMPRWQALAARIMHWSFYGLTIGMPLTGWALVSASPITGLWCCSAW